MTTKVTLEIDADNLPPEVFETYCYRRTLIGEIQTRLWESDGPRTKVYRNARRNIELWWSGKINIPGYTYRLDDVLNDVYHLLLGKETTCVFFEGGLDIDTSYNSEDVYTSKEIISEAVLLYILRKTWNKMRSHRNSGYKLMWCSDGNLYRVKLTDPETYKKEETDNNWRIIE